MRTSTPLGPQHRKRMISRRRATLFVLDVAVLAAALVVAYLLRFDFAIPEAYRTALGTQIPVVVTVQLAAMYLARIPRFAWRYIGIREVRAFVTAAAFSAVPLLVMRSVVPDDLAVLRLPVSVILADTLFAFGSLLGARLLRRMAHERAMTLGSIDQSLERPRRVVLYGAGRAGVMAVREIRGRSDVGLDVVGFVDDDPLKQGMVINGAEVLGLARDLPTLAARHDIEQAVMTIAAPTPDQVREFEAVCQRSGVSARTIPGFYEVLQGKIRIDRFREVTPEQLLRRDPVSLDQQRMRENFRDKRVLISGAGGSIGSELCRQVCELGPSEVILVERAEFALFTIDREIRKRYPDLPVGAVVADVGDKKRIRAVFGKCRPEVVIHAAAHKHVPLMEDNAAEAVRNNVLATHSLADMAGQFNVERFVLVSTDKAVRPTSVMGGTKRFAELVIQDLSSRYLTKYCAVRFGNVLGSVGSVIPIFEEQIRGGGPVTVTHRDMERFFMTIPEASQLVLEAGAMGERGEIFVLDMGEPVKIVELAERMIELHGFRPYVDVDIEFTGVRPGEKLYEELGDDADELTKTRHPKIFIGTIPPMDSELMENALATMDGFALGVESSAIRDFMNETLGHARLGRTHIREA
ncbi:MAG: NAD-dependent epimerase/dehydratase family protein [Acidobacteria bacterium]|nr:NAD-dependent epimerase/dehydratase family protein [Acidobacteriota bacterium]